MFGSGRDSSTWSRRRRVALRRLPNVTPSRANLPKAEQEARHLLRLAAEERIVWAAVDAWQVLAVVHQTRGELADALEARRSAAKAARAAGLQERDAL